MSTLLHGPTDGQLEQLRKQHADATSRKLSDGTAIVSIPALPLSSGWNQSSTAVCFVVPLGYPVARPDCFYADRSLRLAGGTLPRNAQEQPIPQLAGEVWLWFSWHVVTWNAMRDSYLTFVRVIESRLAMAA